MSNNSIDVSQSHVDRLIAHQDTCTAKLQEQICIIISNQEKLHQQLLAGRTSDSVRSQAYRTNLLARSTSDLVRSQAYRTNQEGFLPIEEQQSVELVGSMSPRNTEVDEIRLSAAKQTAIFEKASDQPGERRSERMSGAPAQPQPATFDVQHAQETRKPDNHGPKLSFQSATSVWGQSTEMEEDRLPNPEEDNDQWRSERRVTRIGHRLQKVATRVSMAPQPLMLPFMTNVNGTLVKSATQHANAFSRASTERAAELKTSPLQMVVRSSYFDSGCACMLLTNTIFIGVQVEYAAQQQVLQAPLILKVIDYSYGIWFIIELLMRLRVAGLSFFYDPEEQTWNIFDLVIVISNSAEMVLSAFVSTSGPLQSLSMVRMVRIARIVRIARVIRVLRFFRSLRILLNAIFSTLKSCVWAAMLFLIILYLFGIIFVQGTTEYRIEVDPSLQAEGIVSFYGSLPRGIFTLFKASLGGIDWEVALSPLSDVGEVYVALFIVMITFMYLAVINVISALFLQGAIEAGYSDREDVIEAQLSIKKAYVQKAVRLFHELDDNSDGLLTLDEFVKHLQDDRIIGFLNSLEIDIKDAWSLFVLLDVDKGGSVSLDDFVEGCLNLKGTAKSVHIAQILLENKWQMDALYELVNFMDTEFELVQRQFANLNSSLQHVVNANIVTELVQQQLANSNPSGQHVVKPLVMAV